MLSACSPGLSGHLFVTWTEFIGVPYGSQISVSRRYNGRAIMGSTYFGWIWHFWAKMFGYVTCFITIFSRRAKHFELNFCIREPFPWMVKPDRQEIILMNDKLAWFLACNEIPDMRHSRSNSTFNNIFRTQRFLRKCDVNIFWISSLCTLCWKKKKCINWTMQVFKLPEFDFLSYI